MSQSDLPETATAMVFRGVDLPLQQQQFSLPKLQTQEVLVRVLHYLWQ